MKKINNLLFVLAAAALFLSSCGKDGAVGPQGPIGPSGATGPTGPTGTTGATGAKGTANVIYSNWFTLSPKTYKKDTVFTTWHIYADTAIAGFTQTVLDKGTVLVYGKLVGYNPTIWPTDQVSPMPITITYIEGSTTYTDVWSALATPGNLRIDFVDNQNLYGSISSAHQYRYVIIPGAQLAAAVKNHVNLKNYGEVKQAFNLKD